MCNRLTKLSVTMWYTFFGIFDDTSLWILPKTHDPSLCDTPDDLCQSFHTASSKICTDTGLERRTSQPGATFTANCPSTLSFVTYQGQSLSAVGKWRVEMTNTKWKHSIKRHNFVREPDAFYHLPGGKFTPLLLRILSLTLTSLPNWDCSHSICDVIKQNESELANIDFKI